MKLDWTKTLRDGNKVLKSKPPWHHCISDSRELDRVRNELSNLKSEKRDAEEEAKKYKERLERNKDKYSTRKEALGSSMDFHV